MRSFALRSQVARCRNVACSLACLLFLSVSVRAQTTGSINGTVLDSSGATISGAALELTNLGTAEHRRMTTSGERRDNAEVPLPAAFPVHPMTRFGLAFLGLWAGAVPGTLVVAESS